MMSIAYEPTDEKHGDSPFAQKTHRIVLTILVSGVSAFLVLGGLRILLDHWPRIAG